MIKNSRAKDCVYIKADNGNKIVILDQSDYDGINSINECAYKNLLKSSLNKIITQANDIRKEISKAFGERFKWRSLTSNPQTPRIFFHPKIHKMRSKVRQIVNSINSTMERRAK